MYLFNPVVLFLECLVSFHDGWLHAAHYMLSSSLLLINLSLQLSYLLLPLLLLSKDVVNALGFTVILPLKLYGQKQCRVEFSVCPEYGYMYDYNVKASSQYNARACITLCRNARIDSNSILAFLYVALLHLVFAFRKLDARALRHIVNRA